eukprot:gene30499-36862_t
MSVDGWLLAEIHTLSSIACSFANKRMAKDKRKRVEESSSEEDVEKEESSVESESDSEDSSSSDASSASSSSEEDQPKPKQQKTENTKSEQKPKALPPGYRCNACGAVDDHAIYNCPNKVPKNGKQAANQPNSSSTGPATTTSSTTDKKKEKKERKKEKAKSERREYKRSIFVSGLPFTSTKESILKLFNDHIEGEFSLKPRDVVLLTFPDSPQRCKGLAYMNFADEDEFNRALAVDGIKVENKTLNVTESKIATKSSSSSPAEAKKYVKTKRCFRCGKAGHEPKECTNPRVCYKCLGTDHISKNCPKKQKAA